MKLHHSFPRPRNNSHSLSLEHKTTSSDEIDWQVLSSIWRFGLLCTPENLKIFPSRHTTNKEKRKKLRQGEPEAEHTQIRMCFTLCSDSELFERKIRGLTPGSSRPVIGDHNFTSHSDLFGRFAISFNPSAARQLGIVPTHYFSPVDKSGNRFTANEHNIPGLNISIIQRIKEMREIFIIMSYMEESLTIDGENLPSLYDLQQMNVTLPYENHILDKIEKLEKSERKYFLSFFATERVKALDLVGFCDIMLSLFQETDSNFDHKVLAFYEQREWRLIHHMRKGMSWYCLGTQPYIRDVLGKCRRGQKDEIRATLQQLTNSKLSDDYFNNCWILEAVDGKKIRDYISDIMIPSIYSDEAKKLFESYPSKNETKINKLEKAIK